MREALQHSKWTYFDLKITHFDAFSEIYAVASADDVLRFLSTLIQETIEQFGTPDDFAGHPYKDNLVLLTYTAEPEKLAQHLIEQFNEGVKEHYSFIDRERRYMLDSDEQQKFPLMALEAGWVSWTNTVKVDDLREILNLAAEDRRRRSASAKTNKPFNPITW